MIGSITAELLIMRKRAATWVIFGIWLALAAAFGYIIPYIRYHNGTTTDLNPLLPHQFLGHQLQGFPFYGGAFALMLGVLSMGSEYGWGTLKTLFTQRPGRLRVFAAKLTVLAIALVPFVLGALVMAAVGSDLIARQENGAVVWPAVSDMLRAFAGGWLILALWAAFGLLLATLSRGTALATGVGILYALVIEGLVTALVGSSSLLEPLVKFFFRANGYSIAKALGAATSEMRDLGPGSFSGPYVSGAQALLVIGLYIVACVGLAGVLLRRRDVA
jgi:ABC-type transport system involved in multi-copper enzyme maturation permease subunit